MNPHLKFVHRFSRTVWCEITVPDFPPANGKLAPPCASNWIGRPKPKHVAAYRQWMLSVHQHLADRWQIKILYALGPSPHRTELWCFEPGKPPRLREVLPVGIP